MQRIYRYLDYSRAIFDVFRPAAATRCSDGGVKFGVESSTHAKFHPVGSRMGRRPPKLKILRNCRIKSLEMAYPFRDFYEILVCEQFLLFEGFTQSVPDLMGI